MEDFDIAFPFECVARANAVLGTVTLAKKYLLKAEEAGQNISHSEGQKIF